MSRYWPEGIPESLDYPDVTVGQLSAATARMYGDRVAVVDGDERLTFVQLHERASAFANALREDGLREGDVALLHLSNSVHFLVGYFGALLAGATVSLANPLQPVPGLRAQLADTSARVAVTHPAHAATLLQARTGTTLRTIVVVPPSACAPSDERVDGGDGVVQLTDFTAKHSTVPPAIDLSGEDVAHLAYTGGTTGISKGVRVLHRNVVDNAVQMTAWRAAHRVTVVDGVVELHPIEDVRDAGVEPGKAVTIVVSPLFHAHALINLNFLLLCGATSVLTGRFSAPAMLESIDRNNATYITGSPTMWHALLDSPRLHEWDLSSVRVISSGAAPIDRATLEALETAFPAAVILEGYGLTEGTCVVTASPVVRGAKRKLGSVGLPLCDTTVEIRALDGDAAVLDPDEVGELWVRGPQVTAGYLNRPEATAEQFVDGWLRTGDIGHVDAEGFVFISDRAKDMLIYKGYNVYPRELEDVLTTHPDVDLAAVVGRTDPRSGQEPVAFVVPRREAVLDPDQVMAFVADQVVPYKKIREVRVLDALPTSAAGKILKTELRALIQQDGSAPR